MLHSLFRACLKLSFSMWLYVYAVGVMNTHLRGRPHQFNLDKLKSAERSVYVRGFPKSSTTKDDLQGLFELFGKVKSIWLPGSFVSETPVISEHSYQLLLYAGVCNSRVCRGEKC